MMKKRTKYIHAGQYVAEVEVRLIESKDEWAPYLSLEDAARLDEVREALQKEDLKTASRNGQTILAITPFHKSGFRHRITLK